MDFRTKIEIDKDRHELRHDAGVMLLGSCFSDNIGERLVRSMFPAIVNPFGTLYNPASIEKAIMQLLQSTPFSPDELFEHNGMWHSFSHHSRFSSFDKEKALSEINNSFAAASKAIMSAKTLIITFGSAFVYRDASNDEIVANCHKLPASRFNRSMLSVDDICSLWNPLIDKLNRELPELHVIFTVSPIRHLADGAHGNQLSKATLQLATDNLLKQHCNCSYFPSFEIMLDELRDYRFYAADMLHPSDVAIDYIMQRFADTYFSDETKAKAAACEKLYRMQNHRFLTDNPEEIRKFKESVAKYAAKLCTEMPYLQLQLQQKDNNNQNNIF